jgi:hypothetical protein
MARRAPLVDAPGPGVRSGWGSVSWLLRRWAASNAASNSVIVSLGTAADDLGTGGGLASTVAVSASTGQLGTHRVARAWPVRVVSNPSSYTEPGV